MLDTVSSPQLENCVRNIMLQGCFSLARLWKSVRAHTEIADLKNIPVIEEINTSSRVGAYFHGNKFKTNLWKKYKIYADIYSFSSIQSYAEMYFQLNLYQQSLLASGKIHRFVPTCSVWKNVGVVVNDLMIQILPFEPPWLTEKANFCLDLCQQDIMALWTTHTQQVMRGAESHSNRRPEDLWGTNTEPLHVVGGKKRKGEIVNTIPPLG